MEDVDLALASGISSFEAKEFTNAMRLLSPLAEQGIAEAQYRMGMMYQNGLGLVKNDDYTRANIPMLPVVAGAAETRRQIVIYAVLMAPLAVVPAFIGMASFSYGIIAGLAGALFVGLSVKLWHDGTDKTAMQLFGYSIIYLFLVFLGLVVDRFIAGWVGV